MSVLWDAQATQQEQDIRKLVLNEMDQLCSRIGLLLRQQSALLTRSEAQSD